MSFLSMKLHKSTKYQVKLIHKFV